MAAKKARDRIVTLTGQEPPYKGHGRLTISQLIALHRTCDRFNDGPFLGVVGLTMDADLSGPEIKTLAARMNANKSESAQIDMVAQDRRALQARIDEYRVRGKARLSTANIAKAHIQYLAGKSPEELADRSPDSYVRTQYQLLIQRAIRNLTSASQIMGSERTGS